MGDLIDLVSDDFPECEMCAEPSKRAVGKTFDLDGPGQVGVLYHCENRACNALRLAKIRAWEAESTEPNLNEMARLAKEFAKMNEMRIDHGTKTKPNARKDRSKTPD